VLQDVLSQRRLQEFGFTLVQYTSSAAFLSSR